MINITKTSFSNSNVLVIGSLILDLYIIGDCLRLSQESPIPIIDVRDTLYILGGAANVAHNLKKLGCQTYLYGCMGNDIYGNEIVKLLKKNQIHNLVQQKDKYTTSVKTRIISKNKQVCRYDSEKIKYSDINIKDTIKYIQQYNIQNIIISEYSFYKLKPTYCKQLISFCNENNILLFIDTKEKCLEKYRNVFLMKLNLKEIQNLDIYDSKKTLEKNIKNIKKEFDIKNMIITLGENGLIFCNDNVFFYQPVLDVKSVLDVSGAGDTLLAVACACFSINMNYKQLSFLCNKAANIVISKQYTQPIEINELLDEKSLKIYSNVEDAIQKINDFVNNKDILVFVNGCFDILHSGHIYLLEEAKKLGDKLIIGLNSDKSIKKLKGNKRPIQNEYDRAYILSSLKYVDMIILFDEDDPRSLLKKIKPNIIVKGDEYKNKTIIEKNVIKKINGKLIFIKQKMNQSTTNIIKKIKNNIH